MKRTEKALEEMLVIVKIVIVVVKVVVIVVFEAEVVVLLVSNSIISVMVTLTIGLVLLHRSERIV